MPRVVHQNYGWRDGLLCQVEIQGRLRLSRMLRCSPTAVPFVATFVSTVVVGKFGAPTSKRAGRDSFQSANSASHKLILKLSPTTMDAKPRRGDAFRSGRQNCAEADEADAASSSFEAFGLALSGLLPCSLRIMARMRKGPRFPFSGARAVLS